MVFYYSLQIREKVLEAIAKGNTQKDVSKMFNINRTTIYRWSLLKEKTNNLNPRINHNIKASKLDKNKLKEYIAPEVNYSKTLKEMANDFEVSHNAIWSALKKMGYVIKKNSKDISREMKLKERNIWIKLKTYP
jgi:transposase